MYSAPANATNCGKKTDKSCDLYKRSSPTEGFLLKAGEACDLESVQSVFARGTTVNVLCTIDEGEG